MTETAKRPPLILCDRCGHTINYHSASFGTSCDFYRCQCEGWKLNVEKSEVEHLSIDGEGDLI